jgi:hypothetical protein
MVAGVAGLVADAMSMAAGEYVSVSSQADLENADLDRERKELATDAESSQPLPELAKNAKRPAADLSTPGVNWSVVSFRRKETSSPKGTLIVTILSFPNLVSR